MARSIAGNLFATAAVSAFISSFPVATGAHAFGGEPQDVWHGPYLGGHVGWASVDSDLAFRAPGAPVGSAFDSSLSGDGFAGGAQVGFNHQIGMLVLGVEADITFPQSTDSVTFAPAPGVSAEFQEEADFIGTVRGRVGAAVDNAFLYFTGGYAWGQFDRTIILNPSFPTSSFDDTSTSSGYALGGGGELSLGTVMGAPMSAKVEYLYMDFGETTVATPTAGFVATTTQFDTDIQQIRAGLNVQLGGLLD